MTGVENGFRLAELYSQESVRTFTGDIIVLLRKYDMIVGSAGLTMDHVGLRFKDRNSVESLRDYLLSKGENRVLSAEEIGEQGRIIYIFELSEPIVIFNTPIKYLELPYPAQNHRFKRDGLEHLEFVIPCMEDSLDELREKFSQTFPNVDIEGLRSKGVYSETMPQPRGGHGLPNPTIVISDEVDGRQVAVKFHPKPISKIVASQK